MTRKTKSVENQVEGGGCWREPESPAFITFSFVTETQQGVSGDTDDRLKSLQTYRRLCKFIINLLAFSGLIPIIIGF